MSSIKEWVAGKLLDLADRSYKERQSVSFKRVLIVGVVERLDVCLRVVQTLGYKVRKKDLEIH